MRLAELLKEAASATGTTAQSVKVSQPPKVKTPAPVLPTAAKIKAPAVKAVQAPKIPTVKPPTASMPRVASGLEIALPSANEILADSFGVNTKAASMKKEAITPGLLAAGLALPLLLGGGMMAGGRAAATRGYPQRLINSSYEPTVGGWLARRLVGTNIPTRQATFTGKRLPAGVLSGLTDAQLVNAEGYLPAHIRKGIQEDIANFGFSPRAQTLRLSNAENAMRRAVAQGVDPNVANVTSLQTAGLPEQAKEMQQAMSTAATKPSGGSPWKWLLGGALAMSALNGGLGDILGLNRRDDRQQTRPMPMMTMPMMYM